MTVQDLGKTLFLLLIAGVAGFAFIGVSLISSQEANAHSQNILCFSTTVAFFWLALVLWVCVALKKACGRCQENIFPQSCCGMLFGFLLFWAFIGFNLEFVGFFKGHSSSNPLLPIFFFLSALLLLTLWLSTTPNPETAKV